MKQEKKHNNFLKHLFTVIGASLMFIGGLAYENYGFGMIFLAIIGYILILIVRDYMK